MKDPHIHVEKDLLFTHAQLRSLIVDVTGLAISAPKTVATGCDRRRPYAMTSTLPEHVTCVACREYASGLCRQYAEAAESLLTIPPDDAMWSSAKITPAMLTGQATEYRALAANFDAMP